MDSMAFSCLSVYLLQGVTFPLEVLDKYCKDAGFKMKWVYVLKSTVASSAYLMGGMPSP